MVSDNRSDKQTAELKYIKWLLWGKKDIDYIIIFKI